MYKFIPQTNSNSAQKMRDFYICELGIKFVTDAIDNGNFKLFNIDQQKATIVFSTLERIFDIQIIKKIIIKTNGDIFNYTPLDIEKNVNNLTSFINSTKVVGILSNYPEILNSDNENAYYNIQFLNCKIGYGALSKLFISTNGKLITWDNDQITKSYNFLDSNLGSKRTKKLILLSKGVVLTMSKSLYLEEYFSEQLRRDM